MDIDLVLKADGAEAYVTRLVADVLGPDAEIAVTYSPPDEHGMVCVVGQASAAAS